MTEKPEILPETLENWQRVVDLMAQISKTPAGLIMRLDAFDTISVFVASSNPGNVWKSGDQCQFDPGVYCENVIRRRDCLLGPDALQDLNWHENLGMKFGMSFYMGYPLIWPDGEVFGTICVLDSKKNEVAIQCKDLICQFRKVIENDLKLLVEIAERKQIQAELMTIQKELENG